MTKKLNTDQIQSELAGSAFFPQRVNAPEEQPQEAPQVSPLPPGNKSVPDSKAQEMEDTNNRDTVIPGYHDTTIPQHHDTNKDTMMPQSDDDIFQIVRRAVKQIGKEPATQRLTLEEKQALMDIEYTYRRQGIKTSGNEIIRIATNYLIQEYKKNGEASILAKILQLLNS